MSKKLGFSEAEGLTQGRSPETGHSIHIPADNSIGLQSFKCNGLSDTKSERFPTRQVGLGTSACMRIVSQLLVTS